MSPSLSLTSNYFELFRLPVGFPINKAELGARYRQLQGELHPDRHAGASAHEKRLAVQFSARVNEAYETLRRPLSRALYLLELVGMSQEEVARQQVAGGFLIMQMELREKLESISTLVQPDETLEHLVDEINTDLAEEQKQFDAAYAGREFKRAAEACVKMQYLDKLLKEAEQLEAALIDD